MSNKYVTVYESTGDNINHISGRRPFNHNRTNQDRWQYQTVARHRLLVKRSHRFMGTATLALHMAATRHRPISRGDHFQSGQSTRRLINRLLVVWELVLLVQSAKVQRTISHLQSQRSPLPITICSFAYCYLQVRV